MVSCKSLGQLSALMVVKDWLDFNLPTVLVRCNYADGKITPFNGARFILPDN